MAKISFNKLATIKQIDSKIINFKGESIEVKQYLPIQEKAKIVENILSNVFDENLMASPVRVEIYTAIEIIKAYTNINLTETMLKNIDKTYDALAINHIIDAILDAIPQDERDGLNRYIENSIQEVQFYNRSVLGLIKTVAADQQMAQDATNTLMQTLTDPEQVGLVKDILEKLG